jgi:hypothetical protein
MKIVFDNPNSNGDYSPELSVKSIVPKNGDSICISIIDPRRGTADYLLSPQNIIVLHKLLSKLI